MIAGVLKETFPGERRVAVVPSAFPLLAKAGVEVAIETGAGVAAGYPDGAYKDKGARILGSRAEVLDASRISSRCGRSRAGRAGSREWARTRARRPPRSARRPGIQTLAAAGSRPSR